jgi:hypothetical protein
LSLPRSYNISPIIHIAIVKFTFSEQNILIKTYRLFSVFLLSLIVPINIGVLVKRHRSFYPYCLAIQVHRFTNSAFSSVFKVNRLGRSLFYRKIRFQHIMVLGISRKIYEYFPKNSLENFLEGF